MNVETVKLFAAEEYEVAKYDRRSVASSGSRR